MRFTFHEFARLSCISLLSRAIAPLAVIVALVFVAPASGAVKTKLGDKGIEIDAGVAGEYTITYPTIGRKNGAAEYKLIEQSHDGNKATLKYDGGAKIEVELSGGQIKLALADMPDDATRIQIGTLIPFNYSDGGTYALDAQAAHDFPKDLPANPHIVQANGSILTLQHPQGGGVKFEVPKSSYFDMTDNRAWKWKIFGLKCFIPFDRNNPKIVLRVSDPADATSNGGAAEPAKIIVDQFGQSTKIDYPDKVKSLHELKADVESEKNYYDSLQPPAADSFGGMPDSVAKLGLEKTGYFHVQSKDGKWLMVDPAGNVFYALGVCTYSPGDDYTYTQGREQIYESLPPTTGEFKTAYRPETPGVLSFHLLNQIRKYGKPYDAEEYTTQMLGRLRKWGFNCVGPFSAQRQALKDLNFPYVTSLPFGPWPGMPDIPGVEKTWDPFDEKNVARVKENFAKYLPLKADDPLLIGYYLVNEPLYEDVPRVVPLLNGTKYACKRRLVQMLQDKYSTIDAFNAAWKLQAKSFDELIASGLAVSTPAAGQDVQAFTDLFFETYYKLVSDTFHQYDTHHMLIGNRFQSGTINNEHLIRTAAKYMDVISFNYYTYAVDVDFLKRIYNWAGKPMMLTEYYYTAPKESGLMGGNDVGTQQERGLAYRNYVEQTASLGFIVGATWFTHVDQAVTGRWFSKYNGENSNSGLISVADRPWKPMLAEAMKTNYDIYSLLLGQRPPFAWNDPRFVMAISANKRLTIPRSAGAVKLDGTAAGFPGTPAETISGKRLVQGTDSAETEASFKLCWDDENLYLLAHIVDFTPMQNENIDGKIWGGDGIELFVGPESIDQPGALLFGDRQLLLSGGKVDGATHWYVGHAATQPAGCKLTVVPDVDGKGYTLQAALPFAALGFKPAAGQEIRFDIGVDASNDGTHRQRQLMWNGSKRNSSDRGDWGRATFSAQ